MSLLPEWLSRIMVMAGMIPVMVAGMMGRDMRAMDPTQPLYWGVMSLGVMVGFATAYPVNGWLVAKGLPTTPAATNPSPPASRTGPRTRPVAAALPHQPPRHQPVGTSGPAGLATTGAVPTLTQASSTSTVGIRLTVVLDDFTVTAPQDVVPPGTATFVARTAGQSPHSLVIAGSGVERETPVISHSLPYEC
jgi:hypothetical protein